LSARRHQHAAASASKYRVSALIKLAFHDADTDTDTDILADILTMIVARMFVSMSLSVSAS